MSDLKYMAFRISPELKKDVRMALIRSDADLQHTCEAFCEYFVRYVLASKKDPIHAPVMDAIVTRAKTLSRGI